MDVDEHLSLVSSNDESAIDLAEVSANVAMYRGQLEEVQRSLQLDPNDATALEVMRTLPFLEHTIFHALIQRKYALREFFFGFLTDTLPLAVRFLHIAILVPGTQHSTPCSILSCDKSGTRVRPTSCCRL